MGQCKCTALEFCEACRAAFETGPVAADMRGALENLEDKLVASMLQPEPADAVPYAGMAAWVPAAGETVKFGVDRNVGTTSDSCGAFGVACNRCESCKAKAVYPVDPYTAHRERQEAERAKWESRLKEAISRKETAIIDCEICEDELRRLG